MNFLSVHPLLVTFLLLSASRVSVNGEKTVNILIMVPWPDARDLSITGWDDGLSLLTAGRLAVKQINERDTILKGYRLNVTVAPHEPCAFTESMESLSNMVRYAVSPDSKIAAILGLYCSTSTVFLSQIAGARGIDLLQLSAANSPIFTVEQDRFPRLLRFLQSAAVFSRTVYELMDKYEWKDIGLVQDLKSVFYVGMAQSFVQILRNDTKGKNLAYHGGLVETNFVEETLKEIREAKVRIIYLTATETQIVSLVCGAYQAGMVYPNYTWIIADYRIEHLTKPNLLNKIAPDCDIYAALNSSIMMYLVLQSEDPKLIIQSSNITYQTYSDEYDKELEEVRKDYTWLLEETGDKLNGDKEYGGVLYDQVWAFAIALQNVLPVLESQGLDIEDYGFGQKNITDILEASLLSVSFRGASGHISFTDEREVGTLVKLYQTITNNSMHNSIGSCIKGTKEFSCDQVRLNRTDFDDQIQSVMVTFPVLWGVIILVIILAVISVITFVFVLLIYYRKAPEVKATSPYLSVIMFCGCYFLCIAAFLHTITATFDMTDIAYALVCNLELFLGVNGCNLLFVTLFIKLFRIAQIFNNNNLTSLGWIYTNKSLIVITLVLSILPDVILVIMFGYAPFVRQQSIIYRVGPHLLQNDVYSYCVSSKYPLLWFCLVFGYLSIFIACIVYLAISTRNIQNEHFKDTKKVNAFIFFTVLAFGIPIPCSILLLYASNSYYIGNSIIIFGLLLLASLSQMMLFMPKVLPRFLGTPIQTTKSTWRRSSFVKSFIRNSSFVF